MEMVDQCTGMLARQSDCRHAFIAFQWYFFGVIITCLWFGYPEYPVHNIISRQLVVIQLAWTSGCFKCGNIVTG